MCRNVLCKKVEPDVEKHRLSLSLKKVNKVGHFKYCDVLFN